MFFNKLLLTVYKAVLIALVVFAYYQVHWNDVKALKSRRNYLKPIASISGSIDFYKQELKDTVLEHSQNTRMFKFSHFRNYLFLAALRSGIDDMIDSYLNGEEIVFTNKELYTALLTALFHFIIIYAFEEVMLNPYVDVIITDLKCLYRIRNSIRYFYDTIRRSDTYTSNLLWRILTHSLLNGSASTIANFVIRTLFRGRITIGRWVSKSIYLCLPPLLQFYTNRIEIDGIVEYSGKFNELHKMGMMTLIVYLVMENFTNGWIADIVDYICRRVGIPENFDDSPADKYVTEKYAQPAAKLITNLMDKKGLSPEKRVDKGITSKKVAEDPTINPLINETSASEVEEKLPAKKRK